jgi:lipopolysaccharide biosynthesis glycosyltransferase
MMKESIWIGFDPREAAAFAVAVHSIKSRISRRIPIYGLVLSELQESGLYWRPTTSFVNTEGYKQLVDVNSKRDDYDGAMSTEFAISRFLVPKLAGGGWALFMDCDMLVRRDLKYLFDLARDKYAVMVVKHHHEPPEGTKMDGQMQTRYARKNWSSVMLFNCDHPSNQKLTVELINTVPGRDLHRFCWLDDHEIGELPPEWNYLVGHTNEVPNPSIVHFTDGTPAMTGYEDCEFADEWRSELNAWASGAPKFQGW